MSSTHFNSLNLHNSPSLRKNSAIVEVFCAGASYGAMATLYKTSYSLGLTWQQVVGAQAWFGCLLFAIALVVWLLRGNRWPKITPQQVIKLVALGALTCMTSIFICYAMSVLPASLALTLLFQFTWIGSVIQAIWTRKPPSRSQLIAVGIILIGTVFSAGLLEHGGIGDWNPLGIASGLAASVTCALFVTLSGRVEVERPMFQRGLFVTLGTGLCSLVVCPLFFALPFTLPMIDALGPLLGFFGIFLPVLLFGLGAPHLPAGLNTILASAELPVGLLLAMLILGEPMTILQWFGVALILSGVVIAQRK